MAFSLEDCWDGWRHGDPDANENQASKQESNGAEEAPCYSSNFSAISSRRAPAPTDEKALLILLRQSVEEYREEQVTFLKMALFFMLMSHLVLLSKISYLEQRRGNNQ